MQTGADTYEVFALVPPGVSPAVSLAGGSSPITPGSDNALRDADLRLWSAIVELEPGLALLDGVLGLGTTDDGPTRWMLADVLPAAG